MYACLQYLLGAILSIATTMIWEIIKKPRLEISLPKKIQLKDFNIFRIKIQNKSIIFNIPRNTASDCWGTATFYTRDSKNSKENKEHFKQILRWSNSIEPLPMDIINTQQQSEIIGRVIDYSRLTLLQYKNIVSGASEEIDLIAEYINTTSREHEFYGFSNENYFSNNLIDSKKLNGTDNIIIKIDIYHSSGSISKSIAFEKNKGSLTDYYEQF